ncbi:hypothetical protein [Endozoicomonas ascidiicola]|uniref:hypothetical protein n=1 Tax=Endozoicomonas ascidiicola TaxID=1698521 RepID=UPI00082F117E|nr:hypothetical protein [Endozoicomonas ascidiicola]
MDPIRGVTTNNGVRTLNPLEMSQQDFIAAVYLERGEMLDTEVRRIIDEIDVSNKAADAINGMIAKSNVAQFGAADYASNTWSVDGSNITLENGYSLQFSEDGDSNSSFVLSDAMGNQLIYRNQLLIPVPSGTTVDALEVGIPVTERMTLLLEDGTEISLIPNATGGLDPDDLSGGTHDISEVVITRRNQGLWIADVNTATPTIPAPDLNGYAHDSNSGRDGYVLYESGGLHNWEYNGENVSDLTATHDGETIDGFFARKLAFNGPVAGEFTSAGRPILTQREKDVLTELGVPFSDPAGDGDLTPAAWGALRTTLDNVRDNLTGSSQLQTVQLQRAMQTYNQNYEAMSNAQQRIYNLLRDIMGNIGR